MRSLLLKFINSYNELLYRKFKRSRSDIRLGRIRYMFIFALAPLFANLQGKYLDPSFSLLGLDVMTWMGVSYCAGAAVLFSFTKPQKMAFFGKVFSTFSLFFFFAWNIVSAPLANLILASMFAFFFGGCGGVCAFFYTYALNPAERFLGAGLTIVWSILFQLLYGTVPILQNYGRLYLFTLVFFTLLCMYHYKTEDASIVVKDSKKLERKNTEISLMLFFFFAHKTIEIFYTYTQAASTQSALILNGVVGLGVFFLATLLYFYSRYSLWHMSNIFFLGMLAANLLPFVINSSMGIQLSQGFHAFEIIGYIASYAQLGYVMYQRADYRLFRKILIFSLNASLLIYLIPGLVAYIVPDMMNLMALVVCCVLFFVFILLTPLYSSFFRIGVVIEKKEETNLQSSSMHSEIEEERTKDVQDEATITLQEHYESIVKEKNLTKREAEVVSYLVQGYLYKQCASVMDISVETVKFHARNAYKKIGISGRGELFSVFFEE